MPSKAEVSYPTATQQDDGFPLDQSRVASAGPLVQEERRGDRATATFEDICNRAIAAKFYAGRYTKAARDGTVYSRAMLQDNLDGNDAVIVSAVVKNAVVETRFSQQAAERLKGLLPKLGKSAYDLAIKIISDIGSATVKKMLGL